MHATTIVRPAYSGLVREEPTHARQAACSCGWHGPIRDSASQAEADASAHVARPDDHSASRRVDVLQAEAPHLIEPAVHDV